jgi:hypothetical protein
MVACKIGHLTGTGFRGAAFFHADKKGNFARLIFVHMIVYNVTVNIEEGVHDEWLRWMREVHIPDVMRTGCFTENRMFRVLADEDSGGMTYSIQYSCATMDDFHAYEAQHAPRLRAEHSERYGTQFVAFRTLLEAV